jgi:hypothetical protein
MDREYAAIMQLMAEHNRSIQSLLVQHSRLRQALRHSEQGNEGASVKELLEALAASEREVEQLRHQIKSMPQAAPPASADLGGIIPVAPPTHPHRTFPMHLSEPEAECERRYGHALLDAWLQTEEVWCESPLGQYGSDSNPGHPNDMHSELKCYPYLQPHKQAEKRPADVFCVATNFVIDFDKVRTFA